jgi:hypothetical protein
MIGAGDVARSAGTGAHARGRIDHRPHHLRMLGHAEVIVRAPDHHVARTVRRVPDRVWKPPSQPFQIGEDAVAALMAKLVQGQVEIGIVV